MTSPGGKHGGLSFIREAAPAHAELAELSGGDITFRSPCHAIGLSKKGRTIWARPETCFSERDAGGLTVEAADADPMTAI